MERLRKHQWLEPALAPAVPVRDARHGRYTAVSQESVDASAWHWREESVDRHLPKGLALAVAGNGATLHWSSRHLPSAGTRNLGHGLEQAHHRSVLQSRAALLHRRFLGR